MIKKTWWLGSVGSVVMLLKESARARAIVFAFYLFHLTKHPEVLFVSLIHEAAMYISC
jgi:hypothetical protein